MESNCFSVCPSLFQPSFSIRVCQQSVLLSICLSVCLSFITISLCDTGTGDQQEKGAEPYEEWVLLRGGVAGGGAVTVEALAAVVGRMFVKYWIYVCGTMFFLVSFEGKVVLYKVVYMVLFLCCVALYQVTRSTPTLLLFPLAGLEQTTHSAVFAPWCS